jgi:hypothetical protein
MFRAVRILGAPVLGFLLLSSGCALVPIPIPRALPEPVRRVAIVDAKTGVPITNAEVVMYADRFTNWMRSFPPRCSDDYIPPSANSLEIRLKSTATGQFVPIRKHVWRFVRPWGIGPLGTTLYEDYEVTVAARAPDYLSSSVSWSPGAPPITPRHTMTISLRRPIRDQALFFPPW